MNHQRLLRLFILTDIVCAVGVVVAAILFQQTLPEPLRTYAENEEPHWFVLGVAFLLFILVIASWIGLWRGAGWAPAAYAVMWFGCVLIQPFGGPQVETGIEGMFDFVGTGAGGGILALLLVAREERRRNPDAVPEITPESSPVETPAHLKARRVHQGLSWLYALVALMMLALPYVGATGEERLSSAEKVRALIFPLIFFTLFLLHHFVSRGAKERKRWARVGSIVLACLLIPGVPIGTVLGVYLLRNSSWEQGETQGAG